MKYYPGLLNRPW